MIVVKGEGVNRACAQEFSDWIISPETQEEIGRFGVDRVRRAALPRRRRGLMDTVPEVLGRSALVSLSATAIALALGVPFGTWLALGRRRGAGALATAVNTGMAIPTVVVGTRRGAAALAQRTARQPRT